MEPDPKSNISINSITGCLTLALDKDIQTRYLIIEINYTLRPFNASKPEIQNIADNEIVPVVYGTYIGEQDPILNFTHDYHRQQLKFVKKIASLNKFSVNDKNAEISLFEEEDGEAVQSLDIESLKKRL